MNLPQFVGQIAGPQDQRALTRLFRLVGERVDVSNRCMLTTPALTTAGSGLTAATGAVTSNAAVNGVHVLIPTGTVMPALGGIDVPNGMARAISFWVNAVGAFIVNAGPVAPGADIAARRLSIRFPAPPSDLVAYVGSTMVDNVTGGAFVGGSSSLTGGGLTITHISAIGPVTPWLTNRLGSALL